MRASSKFLSKITLWHSENARSLRCLWTMEEIGIKDYKLITMPFPPRVHYKKFLEKNMLGTIPYFEDENNCMTESSAICLYLVEKFAPTSLQVKPDEPDFSSYLNWIHHADATLTFPQTVLLRYTLQQSGRADAAAIDYGKWYLARLRLLDKVLEDGREFLVSDRFTIADVCIAYALYIGRAFDLRLEDRPLESYYRPQTLKYLESHIQRDAFQQSLIIQRESAKEFLTKLS